MKAALRRLRAADAEAFRALRLDHGEVLMHLVLA